ncbi:MAG: hypothetical protein OEZ38_03350 [Gammaproteobacteria bacterium]|nr:hypothetical protein [Gammaproteobacteria bacterium]
MFLRLYFLLPNERLAQNVIPDLLELGVRKNNIHAIIRHQPSAQSLPASNKWQRMDISHLIEDFAWNCNFCIFFLALLSFAISLFFNMNSIAIASIIIMAFTFILGDLFATLIPRVHLDEFEDALKHGEVLLMVDTTRKQSTAIEEKILKHHSTAIAGGSCWTISAIGI